MSRFTTVSKGTLLGFGLGFGLAAGVALSTGFAPMLVEQKIGYIESETIIEQMPETKSIQQQLQKMKEKAQTDLQKSQKEYTDAVEDYQKKMGTMAADAKQKKEDELRQKGQKLQELGNARQQELQEKQVALLKPLEEKVVNAVSQVAIEQGFAMVLNKGGVANPLVYGNKSFDLTYKVLDKINTGKVGVKSPK
ncbi:MAG: OmpH family outer membrane protein [Rhizobacter sp.]|nr:OmpH family outer membrane protein [Chlorobiales bacterium]